MKVRQPNMLKQRILTALILIPLTLLVLYYLPPVPFLILISFITLGAAWEWTNLMGLTSKKARFFYLLLTVLAFVGVLFVPVGTLFIATFVWWIIASLLVIFYPRLSRLWSKGWIVRGLMGFLVLVPCWAAINFIRNQDDGFYRLLFLFVIIWGADSAAYFVGRKWGKTKLAPRVSPGKSVQGAIGAFIFTLFIVFGVVLFLDISKDLWLWCFAISLITVLFSIMGDLFESMLKREAGLKDSGNILPGHGGLLDRIDSLTAAAPVFVLGVLVLGTYLN